MSVLTKRQDVALDSAAARLAQSLKRSHFAKVAGAAMANALEVTDDDIARFTGYWEGLTLDRFMGDNGRYRYRRYSVLDLEHPTAPFELRPHGPYEQSTAVNPLNGGLRREFDPIEPGFLSSPVLQRFLRFLATAYDRVEGVEAPWVVRLHPYRIRADVEAVGKPAPEGLHRDGVDFVLTLMLRRHNIRGGESSVATSEREVLWRHTLTNPLDLLVCNDREVMHGVTDIERVDPTRSAWRDVLVVAFSRQ